MPPSLTWYSITGAGPYPATRTVLPANTLDYGSVQAGSWSPIKCVVAAVTNANLTSIKFWWFDYTADVKGSMKPGGGNDWAHKVKVAIQSKYVNPATDDHTATDAFGGTYSTLGISSETAVSLSDCNAGSDTDCIYLVVQPPANAADGLWAGWGYRLSFLYSS